MKAGVKVTGLGNESQETGLKSWNTEPGEEGRPVPRCWSELVIAVGNWGSTLPPPRVGAPLRSPGKQASDLPTEY